LVGAQAHTAQIHCIRSKAPVAREAPMTKGLNQKKEQKKKPAKTMKEKRAEKREKNAPKVFAPT
jgi:hypothetical protein